MDPWVSDLSLLRKVDQRTNPVPLIASVELWPLQRHPYDLRVYEYRRSLFGLQGKTPGHELMSFRVTTFHLLSFFFLRRTADGYGSSAVPPAISQVFNVLGRHCNPHSW